MRNIHFLLFYGFLLILSTLLVKTACAENKQKQQSQLKQAITTTRTHLKTSRDTSNKLKQRVRKAEDTLNIISRKLFKTDREISRLTSKLNKSNKQKARLEKQTKQQKEALAQQMQALYTAGQQSPLRLLLKQDDPSDLNRTVKYFEFLNQHRLKRIQKIDLQLKKIQTMQAQINKDSAALQALQKEQIKSKKLQKKIVAERESALKKQRKIVISQERKLARLLKEEAKLKQVIQAVEAKQRQQEQTAERQQLARQSKNTKRTNKKNQVSRHFVPNKPFSSLRGKLSWPVRGTMLHRYGSIRNSKQKWKAVVISAPGGANVHAVAPGEVVYAGRINGYGFVIIIKHDKKYLSLYGYNRSVYKKVGDRVKAGEIIAAVGNTGSLKKTGLYFEIRRGTTQQNPAKWCR